MFLHLRVDKFGLQIASAIRINELSFRGNEIRKKRLIMTSCQPHARTDVVCHATLALWRVQAIVLRTHGLPRLRTLDS